MSEVHAWSTTAASNNSASPNGWPEGMAPSGVNDSARENMAALARYRSDTDGVNTSTGSANAYVLAASRVMTAYAQGDLYTFKANFTNTGAATLNVDGLGAKAIQSHTAALLGGEIVSAGVYTVVYDGTQFQLLNPKAVNDPFYATSFQASAAGTTSMATATYTRVALATENLDVGGNFATNFYTAPSTGYYFFEAALSIAITDAIATTLQAAVEIADGAGVNVSTNVVGAQISDVVATPMPAGGIILSVTAGQRIYLMGYQNSGSARNATTPSRLMGWRIY